MVISEYTNTDLSNLLIAIYINSGGSVVNKDCLEILKRDLIENRPHKLVHLYTSDEVTKFVSVLEEQGFSYQLKEIIPNNYGIGLTRNLGFENEEITSKMRKVSKYNRYYIVAKKGNKCLFLTFNPEFKKLQLVNNPSIYDGESFQTLQINAVVSRNYEVLKELQTERDMFIIYNIVYGGDGCE